MKVVWTRLSIADIGHVRDYISEDNPSAADVLTNKIRRAAAGLAAYPKMGRTGRVKGTRELVILGTPYIVPYRIQRDRLEILAVIHGSRRWPSEFS